jgi:single-stranded-DNA-specific exonuclease
VVRELEKALSLPRPVCAILAARGLHDGAAAKAFLRPRLDALHPPERLTDAVRAAERLSRAIEGNELVFVHGDYDVDGVCSAALLTSVLRQLGGRVEPFVPHRVRDGYDLGRTGVQRAKAAGATLLVTCDSGIVAHDAVRHANEMGIEVIVTDHHTPGDTLPPAYAVVNPKRSDCDYPEDTLCGAGVVFKILERLVRERTGSVEALYPHLDLVALATIADLVPLRGENRILAHYGLRYLARTTRPGLRALLQVSGVDGGADARLEAGQVGFQLAPRINAVGRLGDAGDALELLLTDDPRRATELARALDRINTERRDEDGRTFDDAIHRLTGTFDPDRDFGVVVAGEGWHPGVIGIVASRVVERIHRPVVLIALDGDSARGSARSIPELHLHDTLTECAPHLGRFGGHRQAAGMDLSPDAIPAFGDAFNAAVRRRLPDGIPAPLLRADLELAPEAVTDELHHWLGYLGPFGMGNPRPVFLARGAELSGAAREVGRGHLKLRIRGRGELDAIGFRLAHRHRPDRVPSRVDLAYQIRTNEYRGRRTLQARLLDLRPPLEG